MRVRNVSDIIKKEDETFRLMCESLNKELGTRLYTQDWQLIFDTPENISDEILFSRIGTKIYTLLEKIENTKWEVDADVSILAERLGAYLNKKCGVKFNAMLWEKILEGEALTKPEKTKLKKKRKSLKATLNALYGFKPGSF